MERHGQMSDMSCIANGDVNVKGAMDSCRAISWSLARYQCAKATPVTSVVYVSATEPRANVHM